MTREHVREAIAASTHEGVVLAQDLRRLGVSGEEILVARRAGELVRRARGIYVVPQAPDDDLLRARVALAHAGPGAVLTGLFAAGLLALKWLPKTDDVHTLVPADRRRRGSEGWVRVRRCGRLADLSVLSVQGLPVAPVSQVLVDAARELRDLRAVRGLVLGAVADGRCTVEQIRAVLARSAPAGTALVRRACRDAERGAASPPEAEAVDALVGQGVPFYVNAAIYLDGVLLGVADLWLVGTGTGGEVDSREYHDAPDQLAATLERDKRFTRAGLSLEHVTPLRLRSDPPAFAKALLAEAARRRSLGLAEPPGLRVVPRGPLLR